jgi:dTDP-L-rhamnose 4-epimerase
LGFKPVAFRYQKYHWSGQSLSNPYTGILSIFSDKLEIIMGYKFFEDGLETRDFVFIDDVVAANTL